jgi:TetR/AcrR family transcriptional regulator, transcriptional repressor for nem operon
MARIKTFDVTEVVDKAIELFTAKGYNGTSAQDIVDTLGISRSSLYDTFGDKQGLFIKALKQYNQQSFRVIIEMLNQTSDFPATLRQIFFQVVELNLLMGSEGGCLMINSSIELATHDKAIQILVRESMQAVEDAFFVAITKAQKKGSVGHQYSARSLARFFHNTLMGLRIMAKTGASKRTFEDVVKLALSLVENKTLFG